MDASPLSWLIALALALAFGIIPMVIYAAALTLFDPYEKEPPLLMVGVFLWGAIVAAGSALIINTLFDVGLMLATGNESLAMGGTAVLIAPPVEEAVKGLAVFAVFVYFRHEFDSVLDGVIYGSLVGFGFSAAENVNYIANGFSQGGFGMLLFTAFIRAIAIGFLHATLTSFTGIGFAVARLNKGGWRWLAIPAGYLAAVGAHFLHNAIASFGGWMCLLGSLLDWIGFLGMFAFILYLIWHEGRIMRQQLREEVALGHLSEAAYRGAASFTVQMGARLGQLFGNKNARLYDLCGELAFKKYQLARLGPREEPEAQAAIDHLRAQIAALYPHPPAPWPE
jgi:RsiW-degrading membrane proteinase PrsW (M82 family)